MGCTYNDTVLVVTLCLKVMCCYQMLHLGTAVSYVYK